jgi:NitT/TauT family transport system substrate-binding protein
MAATPDMPRQRIGHTCSSGRTAAGRRPSSDRSSGRGQPPAPTLARSLCLLATALVVALAACAPGATPAAPTAGASKPTTAPAAPAAQPVASPSPAAAASPAASPSPAAKPAAAAPAPVTPQTVRLGLLSSASDAGLFIAIEKGYFRDQGVEIQSSPFDSAAQMVAPLGTGQLDVGGGAPSAGLANALARGINIKVVADKGTPSIPGGVSYQGLMIRKDLWDSGEVRGPESLKGRKVALPNLGGISPEVLLQRSLQTAGLTTRDVEIVQLAFPDMLPAFGNSNIDASILIEPFVTTATERSLAVKWPGTDSAYPDQQVAVLLYAQGFIEEKPDLARRFMVAYVQALRDYNDAFVKKDAARRQEVIGILTKHTTIKDPALYEKVAMPGLDPNGRVNADALKADQAYYIEIGKQQAPINIDELVDLSFVEHAAQQLGPYR